jgi:NitT/TauT family transport system substrate-binding protein
VVSGNSQENAYVAQAKGFFKQHGLNAQFTVLNGGGAEAVAALQSGSMTMAEGNIVSVLQGAQHGIDTPCFAGGVAFNTKGNAFAVVGRQGVTSPAQLAGKSIAVISDNSANTLLVDAYLTSQGVNYKDVNYVIIAPPNMGATLTSGSAQAAAAPDPFSTQILQQGGTILSRDPDAYIPGQPEFACWQASSGWLSSHKDVASKFIAAMNEADSYMAANPTAANAAAAPLMKLSAASLDALVPWRFTMAISKSDITDWLSVAQRFGVLHGSINMADVLTPVQ